MASKAKKLVVIGLLGPTLDRGTDSYRWERWRPSVSVCQHEELLVSRFELIHEKKFMTLAKTVETDIHSVSPETEVRRHEVTFRDAWDFGDVYAALHDFTRQYHFDTDTEDYLIHITTGTHVAQICLFLLTEARYLPGKLLQTSPNTRKEGDRVGFYSIIDLDLSRYDQLATRFHQETQESLDFLKSGIKTQNKEFNGLIEMVERVAIASKDPVLLMGPTGAGKSQLARKIYELKKSRRQCKGAFVEVNCATLRGDSAMSTLFGHTKGSFTGAVKDRAGLLKAADGGLLFLDEIGELGSDEQAMLLRALEEHIFFPLGSDQEVESHFQLIAGTNRDLQAEVQNGNFREDLLARINLWTFRLPGLRERREDIEPNIDYELERFSRENDRRVGFNKEARSQYLDFAQSSEAEWRANFRDLNASITRMALLANSGRINESDVDAEIQRLNQNWKPKGQQIDSILPTLLGSEKALKIDPFDQAQLEYVIKICRESKSLSDAGRKLFSISREQKRNPNDADRLRKYLLRFDLEWEQIAKA